MMGRGHRGRPGGGRGGRGRGGGSLADLPPVDDLTGWLAGRLPEGWFVGAPDITVDREEIVVVGELAAPKVAEGTDEAGRAAAASGRIERFREETRDERVEIARQAEHRYGRKVAWGAMIRVASGATDREDAGASGATGQEDAVASGATGQEEFVEELFTTLSVPVMTRLRQPERRVLDTLVDAGVARSRSEALAWAVALVGEHTSTWLGELREAMGAVDDLRSRGPRLDDDSEEAGSQT